MPVPLLILTTSVILLYKFRSRWLHLFTKSPDEAKQEQMHSDLNPQQLCPKCGEAMEAGRAIITYRDDTLPFLCPHEVPTFLRSNIRMAPTLTQNPFSPEPRTVYRCRACGIIVDAC